MKSLKLLKQTFEIRYESGYRYLDKTGETMLILEKLLPDLTGKVWMPIEVVPAGAKLKCPELDLMLIFDSARMIVDNAHADVPVEMASLCDTAYAVLSARFDLKVVIRIGFRRFFICPADSVEDAERLSLLNTPCMAWPGMENQPLRQRSMEATSTFEAEDQIEGCRIASSLYVKGGAPEVVDERVRLPARLLPSGQKEALLAQLRMQKQRENDPVAGLMMDIDYYWARPPKPGLPAFFSRAIAETERLADAYIKRRNL